MVAALPNESIGIGTPRIRHPGLVDYVVAWEAMRRYTEARGATDRDEVWLLQHPPVYTGGQRLRDEVSGIAGIPVVQTDRGGMMTYHGPGQWIVYVLLDLRRRGRGVRWLVQTLEQAVIDLLAGYGIAAARRAGAPGVYVDERKIAALGLRVCHGCSYHGLSLNVDMDLAPFAAIDPCGYPGLAVTSLRELGVTDPEQEVGARLLAGLVDALGYTGISQDADSALTELP